MFTGIVQRISRIRASHPTDAGRRYVVDPAPVADSSGNLLPWNDLELGESVAVNGCCLTLVGVSEGGLEFDVVAETLRCTNLGDLAPGALVNLERSLRVGDRLGGHYVTGHVDAVGRIRELGAPEGAAAGAGEIVLDVEVVERRETFRAIPKGSVAVDGVSLTLVDVAPEWFRVALIPHTLEVTNMSERKVGDRVNLETDHFGKWVEHLLATREDRP